MNVAAKDRIKALADRVRAIAIEEANLARGRYWAPQRGTARDHWRGKPRPLQELDRVPITVEPEIPMWARMLGFRVDEFYTDPAVYLEHTLRMMIFRHENWGEDTSVGLEVPIWLGSTLESSLFGADTIYAPDESPWLSREHVIGGVGDLARLVVPNFATSGLMPLVHRFYDEIRNLLDADFQVLFPEWGRGPFGVAFHLRGYEELAADLVLNPGFVHAQLQFLTEARKDWYGARARHLGQPVGPGNLYNDEVAVPLLSPERYQEFVLPYETELSRFHGGILYWHSCGDTTALASSIARIPDLEMYHVGPWTDVRAVVRSTPDSLALEICLHPLRDVQAASASEMEDRLVSIVEACRDRACTVRADGLQILRGIEEDLRQIDRWTEVAARALASGRRRNRLPRPADL